MRRLVLTVVGFALATCTATAEIPAYGTEVSPELTDAENDVAYDPLHQGGPHPYLDIVASWLEYLPANDSFLMTFKTTDARGLDPVPPDYSVSCGLSTATYLDDVLTGHLTFNFQVFPTSAVSPESPTFEHVVRFSDDMGEANAPLKHGFKLVFEEPGYARFWLDRPVLQQVGTRLEGFSAFCYENYRPGGGLSVYRNDDNAAATQSFALDAGNLDMNGEEPAAEPASTFPAPATSQDSPGVGILLGFLALVVIAFKRRQ